MTDELKERTAALYRRALAYDSGERSAFLSAECGADSLLRREVESLLATHEPAGLPGTLIETELPPDPTVIAAGQPASGTDSVSLTGRVFDGKYRVEALLGRGGMGAVYRATQLQLDRPVALKLMLGHALLRQEAVARFKREALTVARLRHPHIVTIFDFGVEPDLGSFIVMELLEGHSLRAEAGGAGLRRVTRLMRQACSAVEAAHLAGVVHRDLKPDNIFVELTASGPSAKVLDFGIAKLAEAGQGDRASFTLEEAPLGTPAYMAPEQFEGADVDARSDVYALGCVLYELLTGRPPFQAQSLMAMMRFHLTEAPEPPSRLRPGLPPALDAVVLRALAKTADARFSSAADLAWALEQAAGVGETGDPATVPISARKTLDGSKEAARRAKLHEPLTSFVGRGTQLAAVREALAGARLVTLTGPGGIGKTRLALRVGAELEGRFPDGVWLVELAAVSDPAHVARAVAAAGEVREEAGRSILATLSDALREKELLVILDTCEHVVDACADLCAVLLRQAPALRILATSREALGLPGEVVRPVSALELPGASGAVAEIAGAEAVRLFVERARLARPEFELTETNARAVAGVCRRLDGIPLAIELAAARARALSVEQILERLEDRFALLTGGVRQTARQQTLRAAVDWSHELLTTEERMFLRRLAVFAGGWTLEAAEAVCAGAGVDELAVLDLTERLVDKSLVTVEDAGTGTRYRMLETIQQYAREKLAGSNEEERVLRAHRDWCLDLAERAREGLGSAQHSAWLRERAVEHDNFNAALEWSLRGPHAMFEAATSLRLVVALQRIWLHTSQWSTARQWSEEALALAVGAPAGLRAGALYGLGWILGGLAEIEAAATALDECITLRRQEEDWTGLALALNARANSAIYRGEHALANALLEESVGICRRRDRGAALAAALAIRGAAAVAIGDFALAKSCYEEGAAIRRRQGNVLRAAVLDQNTAEVLCLEGEYEEAATLLERCEQVARELSTKDFLGDIRVHQALVCGGLGAFDRARAHLVEAAAISREFGDPHQAISLVEGAALVGALAGDAERAVCLSAAADALRMARRLPRWPSIQARLDRIVAAACDRLSAAAIEQARAKGGSMTAEVAIAYALSE